MSAYSAVVGVKFYATTYKRKIVFFLGPQEC